MGGSVQEGELGRHRGRLRLARLSLVGLALFGGALEAGELRDVRVCADPANLPFSSKDPAVPGFEVELARALAPDATFHWVPTYRWVFIARQLLDRRCNVFFGLPADPRFEGENRSIALSRPYYVMGQVLVSRAGEGIRGLGDLKDKVVGVQAATPGDLLVVERGDQRRTYLTPEETFEAVRTRHVDAAVMWSPPAGWLAKKASGIELTWIRDPEGEFKIAVGMRKEDRGLKSAVDQTIKRLVEEKTVEAILGRYGVPILGSP